MPNNQTMPWLTAFEHQHGHLLRFFTRKLGCRHLAADCTQDTFVHLARITLSMSLQNPRAFLF